MRPSGPLLMLRRQRCRKSSSSDTASSASASLSSLSSGMARPGEWNTFLVRSVRDPTASLSNLEDGQPRQLAGGPWNGPHHCGPRQVPQPNAVADDSSTGSLSPSGSAVRRYVAPAHHARRIHAAPRSIFPGARNTRQAGSGTVPVSPSSLSSSPASAANSAEVPAPARAPAQPHAAAARPVKFSTFDVTNQVFYRSPDGAVAAIVNLKPIVPGHVLVIPTHPYHRLKSLPPNLLSPLLHAVQQISTGLERIFGADALTVSIQDGEAAGQTVDHLHVHILPRRTGDFVENDEIYHKLETWGFGEARASKVGGVDADAERKPRTRAQMEDEASYLSRFFRHGRYVPSDEVQPDGTVPSSDALKSASEGDAPSKRSGKLPVTLLSGLPGSGKATLLTHILTSPSHNLRVGVIVDDASALNIDASLVASRHPVGEPEPHLVQMQNGCICCSSRGDLLEEMARIAERGDVDYLVVESAGVLDPMQVAETLSAEFTARHDGEQQDDRQRGGHPPVGTGEVAPTTDKMGELVSSPPAVRLAARTLDSVPRLDTCVSVLDAPSFFANLQTADFLSARTGRHPVPTEHDRSISDVQTDQVELAHVLVINKCDLVARAEVDEIVAFCRMTNPAARVVATSYGEVEVEAILGTGLFDSSRAVEAAGRFEGGTEEVEVETEEGEVGSFVYRAHRPFHPERLWNTIREVFAVVQTEYIDKNRAVEPDPDGVNPPTREREREDPDGKQATSASDPSETTNHDPTGTDSPHLALPARLASKARSPFSPLLRSRGIVWLATRPLHIGAWSQTGGMLTLTCGGRWRRDGATSPSPSEDGTTRARQEIVLIGRRDMRNGAVERLRAALDACLLDEAEWRAWQTAVSHGEDGMRTDEEGRTALQRMFADGFQGWPDEEEADTHEEH